MKGYASKSAAYRAWKSLGGFLVGSPRRGAYLLFDRLIDVEEYIGRHLNHEEWTTFRVTLEVAA